MKTARHLPLACSLVLVTFASLSASGDTRAWSGAGGNALWSNAANWDGGVAPKNGDDVVFAGQSTTNDLTGLSLASILVTAGAPVVVGNSVTAGAVRLTGGTLILTRSQISGNANVTVDGGTLILDHTEVGNITVNSGALEVTSQNGSSSAASLTLGPSAQFVADLYGTQWDPYVDYLVVQGNVSLGGSTLVLHLMRGLPIQPQLLIHNMGGNPVSGTFSGLSDGEIFPWTLMDFRIGYHGGSSGNDVPLVLLAATDTWLSSSQSPASYGTPVTILAHVKSGNWGFSGGPVIGTVEFFDGGTILGAAAISDGFASLTTGTLTPGSHTITSHYGGGGNFGHNDGHPLTQVIEPGTAPPVPTQTALSVSSNPAPAGTPLLLHATVVAMNGSPQGMVNFLDGAQLLGSRNVASDQTASLMVDTLSPGMHTLTALYLGAGGFNTSSSAALVQRIDANAADCAPAILVPPADTWLSSDGRATLSVVSSGGEPQSFQWYVGTWPDMTRPLAATATATLTNTSTPTDVWVLITNSCGSAHASAHVNAYVPPRRRAARH